MDSVFPALVVSRASVAMLLSSSAPSLGAFYRATLTSESPRTLLPAASPAARDLIAFPKVILMADLVFRVQVRDKLVEHMHDPLSILAILLF